MACGSCGAWHAGRRRAAPKHCSLCLLHCRPLPMGRFQSTGLSLLLAEQALVQEGKVRYLGLSEVSAAQVRACGLGSTPA